MDKLHRLVSSPAWITTDELANWWGMNPKTIGNMIRDGRIPGKKLGHIYIIPANVRKPEKRKGGRPRHDTV